MTGPVFTGTSLSWRTKIDERIKRYETALALCEPGSRRASDYRNSLAMLRDMAAVIEHHRNLIDPPLVQKENAA
jgi:hypothetical protein